MKHPTTSHDFGRSSCSKSRAFAYSNDHAESEGLDSIPDTDIPNERLSSILECPNPSKRQQTLGGPF